VVFEGCDLNIGAAGAGAPGTPGQLGGLGGSGGGCDTRASNCHADQGNPYGQDSGGLDGGEQDDASNGMRGGNGSNGGNGGKGGPGPGGHAIGIARLSTTPPNIETHELLADDTSLSVGAAGQGGADGGLNGTRAETLECTPAEGPSCVY
jgi:hypothetical protein